MNCDRIAHLYKWMEYAAFGRTLERSRLHFLHRLREAKHALILGDGDGRFSSALATVNPSVYVDSIDLSRNMLRLAARNFATVPRPERIRLILADARSTSLDPERYDLVVAHFFLDCLSQREAAILVNTVSRAACPHALWVVSEFAAPSRGWRKLHGKAWIHTMYKFFRATTGLSAKSIPHYQPHLQANRFNLKGWNEARFGLIRSELWQRGL